MTDQLDLTTLPCPDCRHPLTDHQAIRELADALDIPVADVHRARDVYALTTCAAGTSVACIAATMFIDRLEAMTHGR